MSVCCCSLAGTAACQNCKNNPYATGADGVMAVVNHLRKHVEPQTNGDKIRSMTDEELADYLRWHNDSYSRYGMDWLDWLKSPVEVDNG